MNDLLKKLLHRAGLYFRPHMAEEGGDGEEESVIEEEIETGEEADIEESSETEEEEEELAAAPKTSRRESAVIDARRRAQEAERIATETRAELETLKRQQQAQGSNADVQWQKEEERLRDPELSDQERWQINSNRVIRQSHQQSQQALAQAQDIADRSEYNARAASNQTYDAYRERVDKELVRLRGIGQNVSREAILRFMVGQDMLDGKFKQKAAAAAKGKLPAIARGKPTGARSDVSPKGATEHQKRSARLANINI